jgi:hypothetical protein
MKRTIKDIEKVGSQGMTYLKAGIYYLFVPILIGYGIKSIDFTRLIAP